MSIVYAIQSMKQNRSKNWISRLTSLCEITIIKYTIASMEEKFLLEISY